MNVFQFFIFCFHWIESRLSHHHHEWINDQISILLPTDLFDYYSISDWNIYIVTHEQREHVLNKLDSQVMAN